MYDGNVNVNSIVENVIQMKIGIMINVSASGKLQKYISAKKVIFGILLNGVAKMLNIQQVTLTIQSLRVIKLQKK